MAILLKIDSSPMGEHSISRKLTTRFVETWRKAHSAGHVITRDVSALDIEPVSGAWIMANHTPETSRTQAQKDVLALSDSLVAELKEADEYVFGVPMHNFGIPAALKLWVDQVVRAGKTFSYSESGPKGLLTGKKATVLIASGGVYAEGTAYAPYNFVTPYMLTLLGFMGVSDVKVISAEGTAQLQSGKVDAQTFLAPTLEKVHSHASA